MNHNRKAEELVRTVGRAFYPDSYVAVLDALTKEKYISKEEFAPRLRMSNNEIKGILAMLCEREGLIRCQELTMNGAGGMEYYYIDYQSFVNLIRYRIHLMLQELKKREKLQLNDMQFQCPSCVRTYTSLEVQKLRTKDNKYACPSCCQADDFREVECEDHFRLRECDRDRSLNSANNMIEKFQTQMKGKEGLRHGIFGLLQELKDVLLLRNLPSDNMEHGIGSSTVADEATQARIDKNMLESRGSTKAAKKRALEGALANRNNEVEIEFDQGEASVSYQGAPLAGPNKRVRETSMPEFLVNSGVRGGDETLEEGRKLGLANNDAVAGDGSKVTGDEDKVEDETDDWED